MSGCARPLTMASLFSGGGPRYKTVGNGVGDPHTRWIGGRLAADLRECGVVGSIRVAS